MSTEFLARLADLITDALSAPRAEARERRAGSATMTPAALEWVARFRRYLASERRLSPHTDAPTPATWRRW